MATRIVAGELPFAFLREQWKEERKNVIPAEAGIYFYLTSDF